MLLKFHLFYFLGRGLGIGWMYRTGLEVMKCAVRRLAFLASFLVLAQITNPNMAKKTNKKLPY